ncbi:hypothetical protein [Erythrobacter sp. SG61-1L]|uniref:hypothetical protein n=1 Tax=Erythrobacter sp. SG61-1L TaxID=1603897 RepID=UPI000ACBA877|nr:hypothetical protein [Erythrobacter sp. SG61-1L]
MQATTAILILGAAYAVSIIVLVWLINDRIKMRALLKDRARQLGRLEAQFVQFRADAEIGRKAREQREAARIKADEANRRKRAEKAA